MNENNQRSLNDSIAKEYLNKIREMQRKSEDLWHEIGIIKLKLDDYLANKKPRSELEYSRESTNADYHDLIDDAILKKSSSKKLMGILIDRGIAIKQETVQDGKRTIQGYYIWKCKLEENNESN